MKSLRAKITLLVSLILLITMGFITTYSLINSNKYFVTPITNIRATEIQKEVAPPTAIEIQKEVPPTTAIDNPTQIPAQIAFDANVAQKSFGISQLLVMLLIAFCGIIATYLLVGKTLLPLNNLTLATSKIDVNKLNTKLKVANTDDEISKLTLSFNAMMTRLNSSFKLTREFSQNAAHELKTPLTVIKSSIQVLELDDNPSTEDYKENILTISKSTEQLIDIITQLLFLTDTSNINLETINLNLLIQECIDKQLNNLKSMNISLSTDIKQITFESNLVLVRSIIDNILSNAIKYNKLGGSIKIDTKIDNDYIQISITDTGIGIADLSNIFQPFFRLDPSRSKDIKGNGLGLSITESCLSKLGGTIDISSKLDWGTTVIINLPLDILKGK